jgi:hypothetical protein
MSINIQTGDLVQCRFVMASGMSFCDTREVLRLEGASVVVAGGEHGLGRLVARRDVLTVIPVNDLCDGCFCRPCECLADDAGSFDS